MNARRSAVIGIGLTAIAGAFSLLLAQEKAAAPLRLSGTYEMKNVSPSDDGTVSMDFSATITNEGAADVSGQILLRDQNDNDKVWGRFGDNSIAVGSNVSVSGNVTVPKDVFASWSSGGSPSLFIYAENDRGDATRFRIPLSRVPAP